MHGDLYIISGDQKSYKIIANGKPVEINQQRNNPLDGILLNDNYVVKLKRLTDTSFVILNSHNSNNFDSSLIYLKNLTYGIDPIAIEIGNLICIQYYSDSTGGIISRNILDVNLKNNRIDGFFKVPDILYTEIFNDFIFFKDAFYHFLTTPNNALLFKIFDQNSFKSSGLRNISYPPNLNYNFHYHNMIKDSPEDKNTINNIIE